VVLALGRRGAPTKLGVPGEELPHVVYRLIEPEPFADKRVLVVGGGNAAADCAIALVEAGTCTSVGLSYRKRELARLRSSVRARIDELIDQRKLTPYLGTQVMYIAEDHVALNAEGGVTKVQSDAVIVQIGGTSPNALLRGLGIDLVEKRGEA
jgi:thioredoxin reductase (NADPH)